MEPQLPPYPQSQAIQNITDKSIRQHIIEKKNRKKNESTFNITVDMLVSFVLVNCGRVSFSHTQRVFILAIIKILI